MALIKQINDKVPQFGENCYLAENATIIGDLNVVTIVAFGLMQL